MTPLDGVLAQPGVQTLGWTLFHFIWQGALAACLLAGVNAFIPRRAANARYVAACVTLGVMLALAVGTFGAYRSGQGGVIAAWTRSMPSVATLPSPGAVVPGSAALEAELPPTETIVHSAASGAIVLEPISPTSDALVPVSPLPPPPDVWLSIHFGFLVPWLAAVWFLGVLALSLRFFGGWVVAQRLRRGVVTVAVTALQPTLERLRERLKVSLPVRLVESARVEVPTVIGCLRPVILLPASALSGLTMPQLEALLAHELAHVRRHDYLVNLLQTVVETLLFYHPAVWWVSHRIRAEREHCCDDVAVDVCGNALTYARALADLEQSRVATPRLAMAATGGSLLARILRLVQGPSGASQRTSQWLAGTIAMLTVVLVIAGARFVPASNADPSGSDAQVALADPDVLDTADEKDCTGEEDCGKCDEMKECDEMSSCSDEDHQAVAAGMDEWACKDDKDKGKEKDAKDWKDGLKDLDEDGEGLADALEEAEESVKEAEAEMSKAYWRWVGKSGQTVLVPRTMSREQAREVAREALREARQATRAAREVRVVAEATREAAVQVVRAQSEQTDMVKAYAQKLKDHGICEDYLKGLEAIRREVTLDDVVKLNQNGVSAEYLKELEDLGYDNVSTDDIVRLTQNGIDPEYAAGMAWLGNGKLSVNDLITLRQQGVDADFVGELKMLGYGNLSVRQIVTLRQQAVTTEYIGKMRGLGYRFTVPELVTLTQQGVTAEFIAELKGLGYDHLTVPQIVKLRQQGVTSKYISLLDDAGVSLMNADELATLYAHSVSPELLKAAKKAGAQVTKLKVAKLIELSTKTLSELNITN